MGNLSLFYRLGRYQVPSQNQRYRSNKKAIGKNQPTSVILWLASWAKDALELLTILLGLIITIQVTNHCLLNFTTTIMLCAAARNNQNGTYT